jgi:hypothetical protein
MKPRLLLCALAGLTPLGGCNSAPPAASAKPAAAAVDPSKFDPSKLGGIHAHHTPEQHAAFLKRVGQLQTEEDAADTGGLGGGGGGGHHH